MMPVPDGFDEIIEQTTSIESNRRTITAELYGPRTKGSYPAIILVHGSGGLRWIGEGYRFAARYLAAKGYVVMIVHFFEATGTTWADTAGIARHSKEWLQALEDAVLHGGRIKGVDRTRIGLIGFSLGA
jgi:dienelactone hydrolase